MKPILEIQGIGKKYEISRFDNKEPYLTLSGSFKNLFKRKSRREDFWALKDISLNVEPGTSLAIIGKNGAGKSTLLKILSKITPPSEGVIIGRGRIASLLEVGTGFHSELTGRENVFMNGSIIGMKRQEIKRNFDEIVEFSGVSKFIDTPLKNYSSGMQLRLAFAVAAFLQNEILIIDEVLAVGDAEFQKKCLGKMNEVTKDGRTVLFVSHNLQAVKQLCDEAVVLQNGQLNYNGKTQDAINFYLKNIDHNISIQYNNIHDAIGNEHIKIKSVKVLNDNNYKIDYDLKIEIEFWNMSQFDEILVGFDLFHVSGINVFSTGKTFASKKNEVTKVISVVPANLLNNDIYSLHLMFFNKNILPLYSKPDIITFEMEDAERENNYRGKINGVVRPKLDWQLIK